MKWDTLKALIFEADLKKAKTPEEIAKKHNVSVERVNNEMNRGAKVEKEHTNDITTAKTIASHHIWEDILYYEKLLSLGL